MAEQERRTGAKFGPVKLYNAIADVHRRHGDPASNIRIEDFFRRQDIEAWLRRGVEFKDTKFGFIDAFVHRLLVSGEDDEIVRLLTEDLAKRRCENAAEFLRAELDLPMDQIRNLSQPCVYEGEVRGARALLRLTRFHSSVFLFDCVFLANGNSTEEFLEAPLEPFEALVGARDAQILFESMLEIGGCALISSVANRGAPSAEGQISIGAFYAKLGLDIQSGASHIILSGMKSIFEERVSRQRDDIDYRTFSLYLCPTADCDLMELFDRLPRYLP